MSSPLTTPSTILVFIWVFANPNQSISNVTDTAGNGYAPDGTNQSVSTHQNCYIYRAQNAGTQANNQITVTLSGSGYITFCAIEVTGLQTSSPLDGAGSTNKSGASQGANFTATPGTFSTTNANDLIVFTFDDGNMATTNTPTGYTLVAKEDSGGAMEDGAAFYKIVSTTLTNENPSSSCTGNAGGQWDAVALAYKGAVATEHMPWFQSSIYEEFFEETIFQ